MGPLSIQLQPFIDWLMRATLQASLLIGLILLLQTALRTRLSVRVHYCLWLVLLARMAMPWMPGSRISLFNLVQRSIPQGEIQYADERTGDQSDGYDAAIVAPGESTQNSTTTVAQAEPRASTTKTQMSNDINEKARSKLFDLAGVLPLVWLAGALVLVIVAFASNLNLLRIVRLKRPVTDQKMLNLLEDCKLLMGVRSILGLVITDKVNCPALFGFLRPRLLLPEGMVEDLSEQELRHVFLHELAHLKRNDIYIGWLISLLQVLHWFNPLIWLAFYRMNLDRELACDALVLARTRTDEPKSYGRTIVNLAERFSRPHRLPGMAGILETKYQLKRRVTMIARFKNNSYQLSPLAVMLIIVFACFVLPDAPRITKGGTSPGMEPAQSQVKLRLLQTEQIGGFTGPLPSGHKRLSPNGLKMGYPGSDNGKIVVTDLSTGVERRYEQSTFFVAPVWSPDGKRIAFLDARDLEWLPDGRPDVSSNPWTGQTISILTLETGDLEKTDIQGVPCDWSRDGRFLLVADPALDQSGEGVQLVDLATRKTQAVIRSYRHTGAALPRLSPDGSYVVYDHPGDEDERYRIYVQPIDSAEPIRIASHEAASRNPLWSADGRHILFLSDREFGRWNLFAMGFEGGKPVGEPEVVMSDMMDGEVLLYPCSNSGSLLFTSSDFRSEIFSTRIDPANGSVQGEPDRLTDSELGAFWPTWSRDGRQIAYYEFADSGETLLCIMNSDGRDKRTLGHVKAITSAGTNAWHPDNEHILYPGRETDPDDPEKILPGVYSISIRTGERKLVYHDSEFRGGMHLSPDGRHLALTSRSRQKSQLYIVDTDGKNRRQLVKTDATISKPIFTPDGKEIIYTLRVSGEEEEHRLSMMAVSIEGGDPREIYVSEDPKVLFDTYCSSWLPDGRYVFDIVTSRREEDRAQYAIKLDGKSDPVRISDRMGSGYCVSPDATKAVYYQRESIRKLWLMSDFLPSN